MADESQRVAGDGCDDEENEPTPSGNTLENFVTQHYDKQKAEGKLEASDQISDERTNDFFQRALAESRRMSTEVSKSNKKLDKIHAEFGMDMVNAWQSEHASEVLQPHEYDLVKKANYPNQDAPK